MLVALRCIPWGIAGTGGASTALGTGLPGEGSRNVRSVMDPELNLRSICGLSPLCDPFKELPTDDVEPVRLRVRFVCTSATDVGVIGLALSAAAAAADESETFEERFFRKADVAAVVAAGLAVARLRGCNCPCK